MVSVQAQIAAYKVKKKKELQLASQDRYARDPVSWIQDRANGWMHKKLKEIAISVCLNRRTAVPSAHAIGKSWLAARLAGWWIDSHPLGEAFVLTTAPTNKQVKAVLWKEMRRVWATARLPGRMNQTEWWINGEMVAMGRKPSDYDPTAFQGIHSKWVLLIIDEGCHDDQTEVMTKDGWKKWSDVTLEDEFLSMNPETNIAEYVKALQIVNKEYNGSMYKYKSRNANFCVTPDHKMYFSNWRYPVLGKWKFAEMQDIENNQNSYFRHDIRWEVPIKEFFELPSYVGERSIKLGRKFPFDLWMSFLGWYCSEGSLVYVKGLPYTTIISQKNQKNIDYIEDICIELDLNYSRYNDGIRIHDDQLANYLSQWGRYCLDKRIPIEVRMADVDRINLFLDAYVKGDGYNHKGIDTIYTSSERMAADLQEVILKTGVDCTVRTRKLSGRVSDLGTHTATSTTDGFVVNRCNNSTNLKYKKSNVEKINYNGKVYCATLEKYNLLLTRRDGYALWSGNCGVPEQIFIAGNSLIANEFSRVVVIGNPDDPDSHFAKVCEPGSGWNVIPVSAFDTPNFSEEKEIAPQKVKDNLVSHIFVDEMINDVGEDSGVYMAKVLGKFPVNKANGLIPLSWIRQCQDEDLFDEAGNIIKYGYEDLHPIEIGVDVGAGGDDTSIRVRRGILAAESESYTTPEPEEAYAAVVKMVMQTGATRVKIDIIGIGWGLLGMLRMSAMQGRHYDEVLEQEIDISFCTFVGVNVGQSATDPTRFPRLRDQLWWEVGRELSRTKGWDLTLVDDVTVGQLIRPTWRPDLANRHKVESKQETMKRTNTKSPNEADALLLAFCEPPAEDTESLIVYHEPVQVGPDY